MSDMLEIKRILESQGTAWEEYKKTNDERMLKLEKGQGTADLEAKLAKLDGTITEKSAEIKELTLKMQRPGSGGGDDAKAETELKAFNARAKASAIEKGASFAPITNEAYVAYKAAVSNAIRYGVDNLADADKKAINVGTLAQGGYLVTYEMEGQIDRVVQRYGAMRNLGRVIPIGAASYKKLVKTTGTGGAKRGNETTAPAEGTSPGWVEIEFKAGTYLSDQRITLESLEDAVQDVEADLMEEIGIEFAEMEGADFITGDGVNGPRGLLTYDTVANASYAWGKLGYVASGGASDFAASNPSDQLIDTVHALKRQYRPGAAWSMNDSTLARIRKFKDGQGNYLWGMTAPSNLMAGAVGTLLGYPVVTDDFMPDVATNAFPIGFGDFKRGYYVVDRKGITIIRDTVTQVPYVRFVARRRVGGGVANFEAIKLLKIATS